jgi:hypothetical protein
MRACKVDANQVAIVKALREYGCSVTHLHAVGSGCPDILLGINGHTGLAEIKDGAKPPSRRQRTPEQVRWAAEWIGGPHAIITDIDSALRCARLVAWES